MAITASSTATFIARTFTIFAYLFTLITLVYLVSSIRYSGHTEEKSKDESIRDVEDIIGNPKLKWAQIKSEMDTHDVVLSKEELIKTSLKRDDDHGGNNEEDSEDVSDTKGEESIPISDDNDVISEDSDNEKEAGEALSWEGEFKQEETIHAGDSQDTKGDNAAEPKMDGNNENGDGENAMAIKEDGENLVVKEVTDEESPVRAVSEHHEEPPDNGDEEDAAVNIQVENEENPYTNAENENAEVGTVNAEDEDEEDDGKLDGENKEVEKINAEDDNDGQENVETGEENDEKEIIASEAQELVLSHVNVIDAEDGDIAFENEEEVGDNIDGSPVEVAQEDEGGGEQLVDLDAEEKVESLAEKAEKATEIEKAQEEQVPSKQELLSRIKSVRMSPPKVEEPATPTPLQYPKRVPDCLIIGARKAGTRAVLKFLRLNTKINAVVQEIQFFSNPELYAKGLEWYLEQMPAARSDRIIIEKSAEYFHTWESPERVRNMNPNIKLILVVREPYQRMVSDYHFLQRYADMINYTIKYEELDHTLEELCINQSTGEINEAYGSLNRSKYSIHMKNWLNYFPLKQIHIVDGDKLINSNPMHEMRKVEQFLNLRKSIYTDDFFYFNETKGFWCTKKKGCLDDEKGHHFPERDPKFVMTMKKYFVPYNQEFYNMVGTDYGW